jgi:energy-coupling factor transport system permease protein
MLSTWDYQPRNTLIERLDPRARLIAYLCFVTSALLLWDARILLIFAALAVGVTVLYRAPWKALRRAWTLIGPFILLYAGLAILTGRAGLGPSPTDRILFSAQADTTILGWRPTLSVSLEQVFYGLSLLTRIFSIASLTILIPFTFDPALYGITFRKLGLPDKLAFIMDLTMRFAPSLKRDFARTLDAQRARGYELDSRRGNLTQRIRRVAPLLVPVVIHSIVAGEEVTDAMDLRAFGVGPRTWLRELAYAPRDYIVITGSLALLVASALASAAGFGQVWTPA